jgi:hypothetical protein
MICLPNKAAPRCAWLILQGAPIAALEGWRRWRL